MSYAAGRLRHSAARTSPYGAVLGSRPDSRTRRSPLSPRCGKPVRRKEQGGTAVLEDPVCGRTLGHRGGCMSEAAWKRKLDADRAYQGGRGRVLRNARRRRAAARRADEAAWAAARALPPDPDAAEHRRVLLAELDAYRAAHRGEWRAGRAAGPWAGGRRPETPQPRQESPLPPTSRMAVLRRAHTRAARYRKRGRRVPVAVAELDQEYARVLSRVRRSGGRLAA